jgi:hypothetical protein
MNVKAMIVLTRRPRSSEFGGHNGVSLEMDFGGFDHENLDAIIERLWTSI